MSHWLKIFYFLSSILIIKVSAFYYGEFRIRYSLGNEVPFVEINFHDKQAVSHSKRETVRMELHDPNECISLCTKRHITGPSFKVQLNIDKDVYKMIRYCRDYALSRCSLTTCLKTCPSSTLKNLFLAYFLMEQLVCESEDDYQVLDFAESIECYQSNKDKAFKLCYNQCNTTLTEDDKVNVYPTLKYPPARGYVTYEDENKTKNSETLNELCSLINCNDNCTGAYFEQACGKQKLAFLKRFRNLVLKGVFDMAKEINSIDFEPTKCSSVLTNLTHLKHDRASVCVENGNQNRALNMATFISTSLIYFLTKMFMQ